MKKGVYGLFKLLNISYKKKWQKQKQFLYVVNVGMNHQNGWENVPLVTVGTHFMNKK